MKLSIKQLIDQVLSGLNDRQKDIVESRYGLLKPEVLTLQAIGDRYHITREGIRRIEAQALDNINKNVTGAEFRDFVKAIVNHLRKAGGVRKESDLINDAKLLMSDKTEEALLANYLKFVLEISNAVFYHGEDKNFHNYWYLSDDDKQRAVKFINSLAKNIKAGLPYDRDLAVFGAANYIAISKKFSVNCYGDFGLSESKDIVPKNASDWAYLILKKEKKPLHFSYLAEMVNRFQSRKLHPQTVHNELIKDENFVLVGKGTYGLKEHGYTPGTAKEVIARLLKKHGALKPSQVVKLVLQERIFKENTVLINLQNKNYFKRLEDGRYGTLV